MAETTAAAKRRLRRIPDEARKRSAQSCDLCRKRRCKCVPAPSGQGCLACQGQGQPCSYTLPRKTRFYGSIDDLSDRYRCLDAIVRAAFPDEPTSTASELLVLGQRLGFKMPDLSRKAGEAVKIEELVRSPCLTDHDSANPSVFAAGPRARSESEPISEEAPSEQPNGLIKDSSGREHYIGPSGSIQFLGQLRKLLISREPGAASFDSPSKGSGSSEADMSQGSESDRDSSEAAGPAVDPNADTLQQNDSFCQGSINTLVADDSSGFPFDRPEALLRQLPSRQTLDLLVDSYFKNVHQDFPLFHRGTFEEEYETFLSRSRQRSPPRGPVSTPVIFECGWICCLHMLIVFGSLASQPIPGIDLALVRRRCVGVTCSLLPQLVAKCNLPNVRALLLLALFFHNNGERNAAWNLVGTATRTSFALGLHRSDASSHLRPVEREVRKRVFCTLYSFEQFLGSSLGRPSSLNDLDVEIVPPREGVLDGGQAGDGGFYGLSLKLQLTLGKLRAMQAPRTAATSRLAAQSPEQVAREILASLKAWKEEAATHQMLKIPSITEAGDLLGENEEGQMSLEALKLFLSWQDRSRLRSALVLHLQYRYVALLATRPFLLRDMSARRTIKSESASPRSVVSSAEPTLSELCVTQAVQLSRLVLMMDSFSLVDGVTGLEIFYAYCSVMVLILRSVRTPSSSPGSSAASAATMMMGADAHEAKVQAALRTLIARMREVITRAKKSRTMESLARVVSSFEERTRADTPATPEQVTSIQIQTDGGGGVPAAPNKGGGGGGGYSVWPRNHINTLTNNAQTPYDSYPIPDAPFGLSVSGQLDSMFVSVAPFAFQGGFEAGSGAGAPGVANAAAGDFWAGPNPLAAFEGVTGAEAWLGSLPGVVGDVSMPDWPEIDTLIPNYS